MTSRERWLAAMAFQPLDHLPFWPKIGASYLDMQRPPFSGMNVMDMHKWIGSDPDVWIADGLKEVRSRTELQVRGDGDLKETVYQTPYGSLRQVERYDTATRSWHPTEMPVKTVEDIRMMTSWYEDACVEPEPAGQARAEAQVREVGESAVTVACLGSSPLMTWVEALAGIESAHLLLMDYQNEVEALFAAMHRVLRRRAELLAERSPADLLYLVENTSTTTISPDQYHTYCLPQIEQYARILKAHNRRMVLHMCGHLKALLPDLATLPVTAFEAFTSPPVGNTTLRDGRTACPGTALIGGTNAALWTRPAAEIIAELERHLGELPHHRGLVITSAGVMPPKATPETIREVCRWVTNYSVSSV